MAAYHEKCESFHFNVVANLLMKEQICSACGKGESYYIGRWWSIVLQIYCNGMMRTTTEIGTKLWLDYL